MARVVALDLGSKRVGVAASDATRTLASPVTVLQRSGDHGQDHRQVLRIVDEYDADTLVVGLPLSLNGAEGPAAKLIRAEVAELRAAFEPRGVTVVVHDERFTTASAHASLRERNVNERDRRKVIDKVAAAVLLQAWLDGTTTNATNRTTTGGPP